MTDRHKYPPIAYRPPEHVRRRLLAHAEAIGRPVSAILTEAADRYLKRAEAKAKREAAQS